GWNESESEEAKDEEAAGKDSPVLQAQPPQVRILFSQRLEAVLETVVNAREKAGPLLRPGVPVFFHFGAQQIHHERWNEGSGKEIGSQQGEDDGLRQRDEEIAGHTRQEKHR